MKINIVLNQTYEIISDLYWKYFRLNNNVKELTKEQKYTLNTNIDHLQYNLKLIKKYTSEETYKSIINDFNKQYKEYGLELKGE